MTISYYVNEHTSEIRAITAWVVWDGEQRQALVRAVFKPGEMHHSRITQARSNFRVLPWLAQAIKCPSVEAVTLRPCTRVDEHGRLYLVFLFN